MIYARPKYSYGARDLVKIIRKLKPDWYKELLVISPLNLIIKIICQENF